MAALTAARKTTHRLNDAAVVNIIKVPLKAGAKVFAGGIVALDAGYGIAAVTVSGKRALGIALETVDNTSGASGDKTVEVRRGTFAFNNHGADPVVQADLMTDVFLVDDNTVATSDGGATRSIAGRFIQFEGTAVLVEMLGF